MKWFQSLLLSLLVFLMACGGKDKEEDLDALLLEADLEETAVEVKEDTLADEDQVSESVIKKRLLKVRRSKSTREVTQIISQILAQNPQDPQVLNALAMHYYQIGRTKMARRVLGRALKDHPKNSSLYNNLGLIHSREGRQKEAIVAFRKALSLDKNSANAAKNLGSFYARYRDYRKAVAPLLIAYKQNKRDEEVANNLAVSLKNLGRAEAANKIYQKRLAKTKNPSILYNHAVLLFNEMNQPEKALQVLKRIEKKKVSSKLVTQVGLLQKRIETRRK